MKFSDSTNQVVIDGNSSFLAEILDAETLALVEPADVPPAPTALDQIRALEAQYADAQARMTRQSLLVIALDKACESPAAANLTRDEVHNLLLTGDNGYAALWNLEQQIAALRG